MNMAWHDAIVVDFQPFVLNAEIQIINDDLGVFPAREYVNPTYYYQGNEIRIIGFGQSVFGHIAKWSKYLIKALLPMNNLIKRHKPITECRRILYCRRQTNNRHSAGAERRLEVWYIQTHKYLN